MQTATAFVPSPLRLYLAAAGLLVVCGCNQVDYRIDLIPKGGEIERRLVVSTSGEKAEERLAAEAERIAPLYAGARELDHTSERPSMVTSDPKHQRAFVSTFKARMPADVGGRGTYLRLTNQMGTTHAYVERFRGNDDLAASFQRRENAANAIVRLALGWCEQEFGQEPGFDRLRQFVGKELARDILNLSLYVWTTAIQPDPSEEDQDEAGIELAVKVGQYLFERDYFTIDELSRIVRELSLIVRAAELDDDEGLRILLAGALGRKASLPVGHDLLAVFADAKRLEASWDKYLATTPEYQELLAEF